MRDSEIGRRVGRVVGLWRYPVKSMGGDALSEADVDWHGFAGDRRWAFVRSGVVQSGFPWLTIRERPDMSHYRPALLDPARPDRSPTVVRTPSGNVFDVADPALAEELGAGARVLRHDRGFFDTFPLSLITMQSIAHLGAVVGTNLAVERFRPNLLVDGADGMPFREDDWIGCTLRIGSARVRIDKRDGRCVVITTDPVTTERNPAILRAVARERQGCLGVYGSVVAPGRVVLGDDVSVEQACGTRLDCGS